MFTMMNSMEMKQIQKTQELKLTDCKKPEMEIHLRIILQLGEPRGGFKA